MKASLGILKDALGRKTAILGDMGELGKDEAALHAEVGEFAGNSGIDLLICVGELCTHMAQAAQDAAQTAGNPLQVVHFANLEELLKALPELLHEGDTILVKASHFMHFEKVVDVLQK